MKVCIASSNTPDFLELRPWDPFAHEVGEAVADEIKKYSSRMWVEYTPGQMHFYAELSQKHFTFLKLKYPDINNNK